jgi:hypothetical protein
MVAEEEKHESERLGGEGRWHHQIDDKVINTMAYVRDNLGRSNQIANNNK